VTLAGQHVVVIGGSSGIGLATAALAAARGARVTIAARDPGKLEAVAASTGARATAVVDATSRPALDRFFADIGEVDHLVLSIATGGGAGAFGELDLATLRRAIEGKLMACLETLQAALPTLRGDGSVTFVTAASARAAAPGTAGLAANNGALNAAVAPLAAELAPMRVNAVCPGIVATPIFERWPPELRQRFEHRARAMPAGRPGRPEEIAEVILLCLANAFVTGAVIDCDGGLRLRPS
jgi:NAD(P)-dependent dehydrogenase (short-subunit alcohol dehydrogenase family)